VLGSKLDPHGSIHTPQSSVRPWYGLLLLPSAGAGPLADSGDALGGVGSTCMDALACWSAEVWVG